MLVSDALAIERGGVEIFDQVPDSIRTLFVEARGVDRTSLRLIDRVLVEIIVLVKARRYRRMVQVSDELAYRVEGIRIFVYETIVVFEVDTKISQLLHVETEL